MVALDEEFSTVELSGYRLKLLEWAQRQVAQDKDGIAWLNTLIPSRNQDGVHLIKATEGPLAVGYNPGVPKMKVRREPVQAATLPEAYIEASNTASVKVCMTSLLLA
jgi:hypothetical protein